MSIKLKLSAVLCAAIISPVLIAGASSSTPDANSTPVDAVYEIEAEPVESVSWQPATEEILAYSPELEVVHASEGLFAANTAEPAKSVEPFIAEQAAQGKTKFTVVVSIYAGWMPWYYAKESGIIDKWAKKYGIEIDVQYMDYIPSVEKYVAQAADACVMTNMECLDMPAASGVDSTVLIVGDYSNGNDKLLVRGISGLEELKGQEIRLVELSVSHYMLVRALETVGLSERDVSIVNASDSDIGPIYLTNTKQVAIVTWNPIAMEVIAQDSKTKSLFDSSMIPGEILDLMVVNTETLNENPNFGRALVGAWYEVMEVMTTRGQPSKDAKAEMAELAGCSLAAYQAQLNTTAMFWKSEDAVAYTSGDEIKENMDIVRKFCFDRGLLGEGVPSVDVVGISFPGGVLGNESNVRMRFDTTYMQEHANGDITLE